MIIIHHRHVHADSTLAAFVRLRKEIDGLREALDEGLTPSVNRICAVYEEMAEFTEDNWDYLLVRVHDRLPTKKKECMFEKEDSNDRS